MEAKANLPKNDFPYTYINTPIEFFFFFFYIRDKVKRPQRDKIKARAQKE
jgi:hypothetical protein